MTFNDVIGQGEVKERLLQMVRENRVPHAMLFCGPEGCGKMALAIAFACHLLSAGEKKEASMFGDSEPQENPMLKKLQHPDLHFTYPTIKLPSMGAEHQPVSDDFATEWNSMVTQDPYFTIDQWMTAMGAANQQAIITGAESDELSHKLSLKSSQGGYKVSVIWLPERMNQTSANKLLKLLEEPPQQTVFIMVSEAPEQLIDTIRSRTQRIDVRRIENDAIMQALVKRRGLEEEDARRIARLANGNWQNAISMLDAANENNQFLDYYKLLMRLAYTRNIKDLKKWSENIAALGREKQKRMLSYFNRQVRENFMNNFGIEELNYMTLEESEFSKKFSRFINEANVIEISELLTKAERDIGQNANAKVVFFDLALQMVVLLIRK